MAMGKYGKCKYYTDDIEIIYRYIECLYDLPDGTCGGLIHIVTDDDNIEDHHLDYCTEYISEKENENHPTKEICELIIKRMRTLTYEQRRLLTIGRNWDRPYDCPKSKWGLDSCSECCVENEEID